MNIGEILQKFTKELEIYFKDQCSPYTYYFETHDRVSKIIYADTLYNLAMHLHLMSTSFQGNVNNIPLFKKENIVPLRPVYDFFESLGINFKNKKILDFGGNRGNLIRSARSNILQENYTCVDIDSSSLTEGKNDFPNAEWIYYNRYNPVYNKDGNDDLPPITKLYDLIIANSVFNHVTIEELDILIPFLYSHLEDNGKLLFTWNNIDRDICFETFKNLRVPIFGSFEKPNSNTYAYICDNKIASLPNNLNRYFLSFYNEAFLLNHLKNYNPINYKPFDNWPLDCIEIKK